MTGNAAEQHRRECEARHWLQAGYTDRKSVGELMVRIEQKRGPEAAQQLQQEMREQWKRRAEWMPATAQGTEVDAG